MQYLCTEHMWSQFCYDATLTEVQSDDLQDLHKLFFSCFQNLQRQTAMKNLTLIIVMSLGHFVLGTFANSDGSKAMYKQLPLSFKDNGELWCPGFKRIKGHRKYLLTKNILERFSITLFTRFQEDPAREDSCIYFWTCPRFGTSSTALRGSCPFPQVFEPSKENCVFYTDAKTKCNQYYTGEMTADEEFELKKLI